MKQRRRGAIPAATLFFVFITGLASGFHSPGNHTADDVLLKAQIHDDDRHDGEYQPGHNIAVIV